VQLHLTLEPSASEVRKAEGTGAEGVVVNDGDQPLEVDLVVLTSPSLALEIVDAKGAALPKLPPPTPGRPELAVLAPGERRVLPFPRFLPPRTPPGRYRVRLRYGDARSEWVDLEVGG